MVNTSLVDVEAERPDCIVVNVDARRVAKEAGSERSANFVMLGAYVGAAAPLPVDAVELAIQNEFTGRKAKFAPLNLAAFHAGVDVGSAAVISM